MNQDQLIALAKQIAVEYGLPPEMVCAVCEQESSWNPTAWRYEPAFYDRYIAPMTGLSPTEMHGRAFSFGLMQIMGEVARELGYVGDLLELAAPETAIEYGCKKLLQCVNATTSKSDALERYNGGGNPNYASQVLARTAKYI